MRQHIRRVCFTLLTLRARSRIFNNMPRTDGRGKLFGADVRRICAVAAASTASEMARLVRAGLRETPTVELRLDWLRSDSERSRFLAWLKRNRPSGATFLATCRRRVGGGKLAGGVKAELHWLREAREAGCYVV